jgi:hypothetical protein
MKNYRRYLGLTSALSLLLGAALGCREFANRPVAEWTKARRIAGKEQKLSHISGLVVDDKFAYVTIGGTIADRREVARLDTGYIDNGIAQSETLVYFASLDDICSFPK